MIRREGSGGCPQSTGLGECCVSPCLLDALSQGASRVQKILSLVMPAGIAERRRTLSVELAVRGSFVVKIPTKTSGRSTRYVSLAITTAGRTLVSAAPAA